MSNPPTGCLSSRDGAAAPLRDGMLVGRAPHADLRLDDPSVSREHVVVHRRNSAWAIRDTGSRNGTLLNGTRIPMYADCPLRDGDRLEVGAVPLTVTLASGADADHGDQTRAMSVAGVREAAAAAELSHYQLEVVRRLAEPWMRGGEPATNASIAASLGTPLAVGAVKAALRRAYVKAGLAGMPTHTKRRELCRMAEERRWL